MILLIDNYDSFTFNLYQALRELGAEVTVVRNDRITVDQVIARLPEIDGIVISPGPCTPVEAGISVPLVQHLAGQVPILGVCLGHQAVGAAFGARSSSTWCAARRSVAGGSARAPGCRSCGAA